MSARVNRMLAAPLVLLVRVYQRLVSPLSSPSCRFYPSCSSYAVTALQRFGPVRGGWLAVRRLSRCHPWNPGGVDDVPLTWATRHGEQTHSLRAARAQVENDSDAQSGHQHVRAMKDHQS